MRLVSDTAATETQELVYSVSEVNSMINQVLKRYFARITVVGEITNLNEKRTSGTAFFALKEGNELLQVVAYEYVQKALTGYRLTNGLVIEVTGMLNFYEPQGKLSLVARSIRIQNEGYLRQQVEKLRENFRIQGYFDERYKKPIPQFCTHVVVCTSPTGEAQRDVRRNMWLNHPFIKVDLVECLVQGAEAPQSIIKAIQVADQMGADALIVGRGGGSFEDLMAYNDLNVNLAIFNCKTPVISAVGHDGDHPICDEIADARVSVPSAVQTLFHPSAAELTTALVHTEQRLLMWSENYLATQRALLDTLATRPCLSAPEQLFDTHKLQLEQIAESLHAAMRSSVDAKRYELKVMAQHRSLKDPTAVFDEQKSVLKHMSYVVQHQMLQICANARMQLSSLEEHLPREGKRMIERLSQQLERMDDKLTAFSPQATLKRGYSLAYTVDEVGHKKLLRDATDAARGATLEVTLANGTITSEITGINSRV